MRIGFVDRWRTSFRFRMVVATVVAISATVAIYTTLQYLRHVQTAERAQRERAVRLADLMAESLAQPMFDFNTVAVQLAVKALSSNADIRWVRVIDTNGQVVVDTAASMTNGADDVLLTLRRPINYADERRSLQVGAIQMAFSRKPLDTEILRGSLEILLVSLLMAISSVLAVLWAFRAITRPLAEITTGLQELAAGNTRIALPVAQREDEFGQMCAAMRHFRDAILARDSAERAMRNNEERFRDFSLSSADWFWEMDGDLRFTYFSDNFRSIFGEETQTLIGKTRVTIAGFSSLNQEAVRVELLARAMRREAFRNVELRARRGDGSMAWVSVSGIPRFDPDGNFLGYRGAGQDVTVRRAAEETARQLYLAVEQSPNSVVITNANAEIEYVNEAFVTTTGYTFDEVRGHNPSILKSARTPPDTYQQLWAALANGEPWRGEFVNRRKNGEDYTEQGIISPLRQPDGTISHYLAVKEDITEKKKAERELERYRLQLEQMVAERTAQLAEAKDAAEAASRAKGAFVANMSHEIRTPLNAVLGLARIIVRENKGRRSGYTARQILEAGEHLLGVIDDILDFSRIEAGKLLIERKPFRLAECIDGTVRLMEDRAQAKDLSLSCEYLDCVPDWVEGDRLRVEQILLNLLSNAIKFTERGSVVLTLTRQADVQQFVVHDTGIGMGEEHMARLFQPFEQADASTTRRYGGSGLGLAISKTLASQMGGDIHVASVPGVGSTFTVTLPLPEVSPEHVSEVLTEDVLRLAGLHILAVEDMELNRVVLGDILEVEGARVSFAENGRQALDQIEANAGHFDLVITDIQMPVMDGYELAQHIRDRFPMLPVIGLTAHAMHDERQRCLDSGMRAHISKPIDTRRLITCIREHVQLAAMPEICLRGQTPVRAEIINWDALADRYSGRPGFAEKLFTIVLRTHSETPARLRTAMRTGDVTGIRSIAHTLQGIAGSIEAVQVCALADQVLAAAHTGDGALGTLVEHLAESLENLFALLRDRTNLASNDN